MAVVKRTRGSVERDEIKEVHLEDMVGTLAFL